MTIRGIALAASVLAIGSAAAQKKTDERVVRYAPAASWVSAPPPGSAAPTPPGAPVRVVYADYQVRITDKGQEEYQASRIELLTPDALAAGNLAVTWSPASESMIVHRLAIIREGRTIDVLATQKFAVIQRENNLEQAMLDGDLTATLQAAGLQVGDTLEFAATKLRKASALGERPQVFMQFPIVGVRGAYRLRVLEPATGTLAYKAIGDLPKPVTRQLGGEVERELLLADPASATIPEGAPFRYSVARNAQFSGYGDWAEVSRIFDVPFAKAASLTANSPIKAEAARIAATTTDPARRAELALRLVQDRIRYVYVGLDGGNYRPAPIDETWARKFGDCKAKTVLLIALLRELGIAAEAVLAASKGGDGIDERLPSPALFDHVVVRATIDGKPVWLDGTRTGDLALAGLEQPASRWVLPLRAAGASLERLAPLPPRLPQKVEVVEIDASAGFDKPGKYRIQQTLRGDEIFGIRAHLAGLAAADADKALVGYWRQQLSDVEPSKTSWRFDEANRLLVLDMVGEGKVDWEGDATKGHTHYLFAGGFPPPPQRKRPKDQPQDVPWANDYPSFNCYSTTVKVPPASKGLQWAFSSKPMNRVIGGVAYWRIASFDGTVARMTKSRRVNVPEITAKEAAEVNAAIDGFDNNKSYVWETAATRGVTLVQVGNRADDFGTFDRFAGAQPPCQSPGTPAADEPVTIVVRQAVKEQK